MENPSSDSDVTSSRPATHDGVVGGNGAVCEASGHKKISEKKIENKSEDNKSEMLTVKSTLGFFASNDKLRGSELSVHSMMVTDEEMSNYMSSNTSINQEKNSKGKSSLLKYKNVHGLSSMDCIDGQEVKDKTKNDVKKKLKEFGNTKLNAVPKHSSSKGRSVSPSTRKQNSSTAKSHVSGKSTSTDEDSKSIPVDSKGQRKRRRSAVQQGLILEVAKLHSESSGKKKSSKAGGGSTANTPRSNTGSESRTPSPRVITGDGRLRLSPSVLVSHSPSFSRKSDDGGGSETSSMYHSSHIYPSSDRRCSDGVLLSMQQDSDKKFKRMSSLSVTPPPRAQSALGQSDCYKEASPSSQMYTALRRASTAAEDVYRTSLPYIPSVSAISEVEVRNLNTEHPYANEVLEADVLCTPRWGNPCGTAGLEEKDINDQTCRSNFGMILSALCFVLFLWYLAMVYSRFINKALTLPVDAIDSLITSDEPEPIQEVVINISAKDLKLVALPSP